MDLLELMDHQDRMDNQVLQDPGELQDQLGTLVLMGPRVKLVSLDQQEMQVLQVHQDLMEDQDLLEQLVLKVI